jgi:hypothetical protein
MTWADPVGDLRRWLALAAVPRPVELAEAEHQAIAWLCDRDHEQRGERRG